MVINCCCEGQPAGYSRFFLIGWTNRLFAVDFLLKQRVQIPLLHCEQLTVSSVVSLSFPADFLTTVCSHPPGLISMFFPRKFWPTDKSSTEFTAGTCFQASRKRWFRAVMHCWYNDCHCLYNSWHSSLRNTSTAKLSNQFRLRMWNAVWKWAVFFLYESELSYRWHIEQCVL